MRAIFASLLIFISLYLSAFASANKGTRGASMADNSLKGASRTCIRINDDRVSVEADADALGEEFADEMGLKSGKPSWGVKIFFPILVVLRMPDKTLIHGYRSMRANYNKLGYRSRLRKCPIRFRSELEPLLEIAADKTDS